MAQLELRLPTDAEEPEFWRAHRATSPETPFFLPGYTAGMSFRSYIDQLAAQARGLALPSGFVPVTFLFAFAAGRIVGRVSIRHELNDFLRRQGGHIGYDTSITAPFLAALWHRKQPCPRPTKGDDLRPAL